jgi:hypothetical protein
MDELASVLSVHVEELLEESGPLAPIPISASEKGIVVEQGEGRGKVRYILPPTPESYEIVDRHIESWKNIIDSRLQDIVNLWEQSSEEEKERIITLLFTTATNQL